MAQDKKFPGKFYDKGGAVFNVMHPDFAYGAAGTGAGDDADAIEAAAAAALDAGYVDVNGRKWGVILLPSCKGFRTTRTVTIPAQVHVVQRAPIFYAGTADEPALVVGSAASQNAANLHGLNVVRLTQSTWEGETEREEENIGVLLHNLQSSDVYIHFVQGFTVGAQLRAAGYQTSFNTVRVGRLLDNKFNLDILSTDVGGAPNDNLFLGGYYTHSSGVNTGKSRYGISIRSRGSAYYANNNVFLKPCTEVFTAHATPGEAIPFLIETGTANRFIGYRDEGANTYVAATLNDSTGNVWEGGYDEGAPIDQRGTYADNVVVYSSRQHFARYTQPVASFQLRDRANRTSTTAQIVGMSLASSSDAVVYQFLDGIKLVGDAVEIATTSGIGVKLDTTVAKKFVLHRGVSSGAGGGRVFVRCYDSNGAVLTSAGAAHPYVRGGSGLGFSYTTEFGNGYVTGSDSSASIFFEVKDAVKSVWVGVTGGTAAAYVRSIALCCDPNQVHAPGITTGLTVRNDRRMCAASPTRGPSDTTSWPVNTEQWNSAPASGGAPGWVCVSQVDTTVRVAHAGGAGNLEVTATAGMAAGDVVGVVLDSGSTHWTTINTVVDGDTLTLTDNMPSASGVAKAVLTFRFKAMANLA